MFDQSGWDEALEATKFLNKAYKEFKGSAYVWQIQMLERKQNRR